MTEFAGVDPQRVRQLANKLKDLADTLEREAPNIRKMFDEWQGTLNQSLLSQQVAQVRTDASDMAKRADQAANLAHTPHISAQGDPHAHWSFIPWDVSQINTAQEAQQEALGLKNAMDNPKDPTSRATMKEVAQSLADHQDDPAYLQAFMANGGMDQAARAARVLHAQDGTHDGVVLSKDSEAMLAQFAQGVQTATTMAANGKITLPQDWEKKLTQPDGGDMWSVGMLFKYGPPGDKWDAHLLSDVGGSMLDWRQSHEMRPEFSAGELPYTGSYVGDRNAWYTSLGLTVDYRDSGGLHPAEMQGIDDNDPSIALMQRVSENADASRLILTGGKGPDHAAALVSDKWHTPGNDFDDATFPAAVIRAATLDRKGHPNESAEAAANLINAGGAEYGTEKGKNDNQRTQYPLNKDITQALSTVFQAYVSDLAYSTGVANQAAAPSKDRPGTLITDRQHTEDFLSMIMQNHDEVGNVIQSIDAQISLTSASGLDDPGASAYMNDLAQLRGEVSKAGSNVKVDKATLTDAEHAKNLMWFNILASGAAAVPNPWDPKPLQLTQSGIQAAIWAGIPYLDTKFQSSFSTNNAATEQSKTPALMYDDDASMQVPIMQGLVRSGKLKPPPDHPEWADGNIAINTPADRTSFNDWWISARASDPKLDTFSHDMADSFKRGAE
ncbi:hypothetical protein AB0M29_26585 [Streptomyces sp. NPDC051976]|uniref:hypothetical protein n=1 Tax=Streptomyces sp. NPDC051976 TaxID=3154947 RepID=UPI00341C963E